MTIALIYVGISVLLLILLTLLFVVEDIQGKRVFLVTLREKLDVFLEKIAQKLLQLVSVFTVGFMRVLFHYGAHSVLKRVLGAIRRLENKVEELVRKNRKVAREIRNRTKSHLDEIAEHKAEVALSDKEKKKMLAHSK